MTFPRGPARVEAMPLFDHILVRSNRSRPGGWARWRSTQASPPLLMQLKATLLIAFAVAGLEGRITAQTFTDTFDTPHDYLANGVAGTIWDGLFFNVNTGNATLAAADANSSNPGRLTLRSANGNWENAEDDGLLLYKTVAGNFDAKLQVVAMNTPNWHDAGIMARVASLTDAGDGEDWVAVKYFAYGNQNGHRSTDNGASGTLSAPGAAQPWLRLKRVGDTFTTFRSPDGASWSQIGSSTRADLAGLPVQLGIWQATFSGNEGLAQFDNFSLALLTGPAIATQPQPAKALAGGTATFAVAATGIEPLEYQWRHAGTNLPGALEATLSLSNVLSADAGLYSVIVTDADGSTVSDEAPLAVLNAGLLFGDNFEASHDYSSGDVAGTIWDGVLNAANLDPGSDTAGGVLHLRSTGEGWEAPNDASGPFLYKTVSGNFDMEVEVALAQDVSWSDGGLMVRVPSLEAAGAGEDWLSLMRSGCCGYDNKLRWADDNANNNYQVAAGRNFLRLERRGNLFRAFTKASSADAWELGYSLNRPDLDGLPLQVGLQHGTFNPANTADRQYDNFWLYLPSGPVITTQPLSQRAIAGEAVTFTVAATGIEPLEYQWQFNGTNLPGATEAALTLSHAQLADAGAYSVVVTDADGASDSDPATLNVVASLGVAADDFNRHHDYAGGNVSGTIWDGVLNPASLDPGSDTSGGVLHWRNTGEGWELANGSGPFLYKLVKGDFDSEIEVAALEYVQWSDGGIMARVPNLDDAGPGEDYVSALLFSANNTDAWAQNNRLRSTDDSLTTTLTTSGAIGERFLRLERAGNTFNYYTKAAAGDAWRLRETVTRGDLPALLQVGLQHGTFVGNAADRQFDNFRLSGPNIVGALSAERVGDRLALSWEGAGLILQRSSNLANPAGWTDVPDVTGHSASLPVGSGPEFFRLRTP